MSARKNKKRGPPQGIQVMKIEIFNCIQLLTLSTICCEGKNPVAEARAKEAVLNFEVAQKILFLCEELWPFKVAIFEYLSHAYFDTEDMSFLEQPTKQSNDDEAEMEEN